MSARPPRRSERDGARSGIRLAEWSPRCKLALIIDDRYVGGRMDHPRGRTLRLLALGVVLIALTAAYVVVVRQFNVTELPGERHFGATNQVVPAGEVYLEPISIDALNDAMHVTASLSPGTSESKNSHSSADHDLTLLVRHDGTVEEIRLAAGDHMASSTFEVDLNGGSVTHYPLDTYVAQLGVELLDGKSSLRLPARVTMWEGVLGYNLHRQASPAADDRHCAQWRLCPVCALRVRRHGRAGLLRACDRRPDVCRRASSGGN